MDFNPKNFIVIVLSVTFLLAVSTIWGFWHFGSIKIPGITQNQATSTDTTATTTKTDTKTTTTVPKTTTPAPLGAVIVYYTTNGFSPTQVEVKTGENVRFINKQGNSMRVVPGADYPGGNQAPFNQESSLGYNKSYEFTASKAGVWIFMNLNNPKHTGTLIVR